LRRKEAVASRTPAPVSPEEELKKALEELRKRGEEMSRALDEAIKRLQASLEQLAPKPKEEKRPGA